jgi:hypothetical protein
MPFVITKPKWAEKRGPSLLDQVYADRAVEERRMKRIAGMTKIKDAAMPSVSPTAMGFPKAPPALRSKPYRKLVASFPCINCGVEKCSQAAHSPPTARGKKESDADLFPLCTINASDCHGKFDGMKLHATPEERRAQAKTWVKQTQKRAIATGKVPKAVLAIINPPKGKK